MAIQSLKKKPKKPSMPSLSSKLPPPPAPSAPPPSSSSSICCYCFSHRKMSMLIPLILFSSAGFLFFIPSNSWSQPSSSRIDLSHRFYEIKVINEFPHDPKAFTQGLLYAGNDTLFESTGLYGESSVRRVDLRTGKVEALQKMQDSYFGEGLTLLGERLFQVTWLKKTGFIYNRYDLSKVKTFTHQMQDGWGLATDGKVLFGSDGTSTLYRLDPQTFKVMGKHIVKYNGREVHYLNELEFIDGEVWANVWLTDCIARISPKDGSLLGWILLPKLRDGLLRSGHKGIDVLNGIAWDGEKQRLFVTGKLWPKLYQIKLEPVNKQLNGFVERHCLQ